MKVYIDFDHTLYNTNALISDMLDTVAKYILQNGNFEDYPKYFNDLFPNKQLLEISQNKEAIEKALKDNFKRPSETYLGITYNIYSLIETFSKLFNCDENELKESINEILDNGSKYLFEDSIPFLNALKQNGYEVYILSHDGAQLAFQDRKIKGSGIIKSNLLDATIVTTESKAQLNEDILRNKQKVSITPSSDSIKSVTSIDYENGIFIDDRPKDLEALCKRVSEEKKSKKMHQIQIYRMARQTGTYSKQKMPCTYLSKIKVVSSFKEVANDLFRFVDIDDGR